MDLLECTLENTPEFTLGSKINAKVLSCYDGDTFTIAVKIANNPYKFSCRLMGCDTPEMKASATKTQQEKEQQKLRAVTAKLELLKHLTDCNFDSFVPSAVSSNSKEIDKIIKTNKKIIELDTFGFDKYGRLLVNLYISNSTLSDYMILNGYAYAYTGGTKQK